MSNQRNLFDYVIQNRKSTSKLCYKITEHYSKEAAIGSRGLRVNSSHRFHDWGTTNDNAINNDCAREHWKTDQIFNNN